MSANALLLAQAEAPTTAAALFTADIETELTRVVLCNTSGAARTFRIFHDDTGVAAFTAANALYWDRGLAIAETILIDAQSDDVGFQVARGGRVAFEASDTGVTVSIYGITTDIAYAGR